VKRRQACLPACPVGSFGRQALLAALGAVALTTALLWQPFYVFACAVTGAQAFQASSPEVASAMEQAAVSRLGPGYPTLPLLERGYPDQNLVPAPVPCVLVKSVGYVEGSWRQAAGSVPVGLVGPVKQSASCGYGIMQITSGMRNPGELPPDTQQHIADDYRYNIGWGAKVLADKWNAADFLNAVVGDRDPAIVEDWYYAVWAYNQFNFRNNPNNPDFPLPRPAYDGSQSKLNYPYQELVWGLAANPPKERGVPLWEPVALALPDSAAIGQTPGPIPSPTLVHSSICRSLFADSNEVSWSVSESAPGNPSATVTLSHALGAQNVGWTATVSGASWLAVSPGTGTAFPAAVTLRANPAGLSSGTYQATLVVKSQDGATPILLPVRLEIRGTTYRYIPFVPRRALTIGGR